jgi:hypothetical protein
MSLKPLITIKQKKEIANLKDDIQDFADAINAEVTAELATEDGFEHLVFTPKSWAKREQPKLFED